VRRNTNL